MTLKEKLLAAGMKPEEIDNHYSDLYVYKNKISTAVLKDYEFPQNITTFRSEIEPHKGEVWYEIPFAYIRRKVNKNV